MGSEDTTEGESEQNAGLVLAHPEMVGDRSAALLNLDHRAGQRGS